MNCHSSTGIFLPGCMLEGGVPHQVVAAGLNAAAVWVQRGLRYGCSMSVVEDALPQWVTSRYGLCFEHLLAIPARLWGQRGCSCLYLLLADLGKENTRARSRTVQCVSLCSFGHFSHWIVWIQWPVWTGTSHECKNSLWMQSAVLQRHVCTVQQSPETKIK